MQVEMVKVGTLKPHPRNPKTHPEHQVERIARSIKEYGFIVPVLLDAENGIIAGHGRVLAAQKLGLSEVPALRAEHLSPEQVRAFRIADNKLAESEWNWKMLHDELQDLTGLETGFTKEEMEKLNKDLSVFPEKDYDSDLPTTNECPSCGYKW